MEMDAKMLKLIRLCAAHTQRDASKMTGISLSMISAAERGVRKLSQKNIRRVIEAYSLTDVMVEQARETAKELTQKGII